MPQQASAGQAASTAPRPIVRAKSEDEPSPSQRQGHISQLVSIPSPEELGVSAAKSAAASVELDWAAVHRRLQELGADFLRQRLPQGGYRFTCLMPTNQPNRLHRVEAEAATEAEAVQLALNQANKWAGSQQ
jgi:hypothetical protein